MKTYKYIILFGLTFLFYSNSANALENVFEVNLIFNRLDNSAELDSIRVVPWYINVESSQAGLNIENNYEVRLTSLVGASLYSTYIEPSYILLSDPPEQLDTTLVQLYFPYNQGAKLVKVFFQGEQKISVNFGNLICNNNGGCDNSETYLSCPNDCQWYSTDTICNSEPDDFYCDWDCLFDADPSGECHKANCSTGGRSGNVCQQYLCNNKKKDAQEQGIDCGGVCPDNCPVDFCGDGICAEYESIADCPADCGELISILKNTGTEPLKGELLFKVQKYDKNSWQAYANVFRDSSVRAIQPGETVDLKEIWNNQNYIVQENGKFRIYASFLNESGTVVLSDTFEFFGGEQMVSAHEIEPEPTSPSFKETIYKIQQGVTNFFRQISDFFKIRLWR